MQRPHVLCMCITNSHVNEGSSFIHGSCYLCMCVTGTRNGAGLLAQSECLVCGAGFGAGNGGQQCTPCAYDDMALGCGSCPAGTTARGIDCISNSVTAALPASSAYTVRFDGVGTGVVDSTLFRERLPGSYVVHCCAVRAVRANGSVDIRIMAHVAFMRYQIVKLSCLCSFAQVLRECPCHILALSTHAPARPPRPS
jgi:hypothetical protein